MERIFRKWNEWECYKAGFYNSSHPDLSDDECCKGFMDYFMDPDSFESDIKKVFELWPVSCENFLTNKSINRIAWIGQACVCFSKNIPSKYKNCYNMLPLEVRNKNDEIARKAILRWENGRKKDKSVYSNMEEQMLFR